jgi:hypothetical protein
MSKERRRIAVSTQRECARKCPDYTPGRCAWCIHGLATKKYQEEKRAAHSR